MIRTVPGEVPGLPAAAFVLAWLLVRAAIGYARRRGMLDRPGRRRSHTLPTPRGGGIGIVAAALATMPAALRLPLQLQPWPPALAWALAFSTALVAAAGWWDDHRSLPVLPRLGAQLLAVAAFAAAVLAGALPWWWFPLLLVAGTWSINLHNFMDGIDGLLASQAVFVGLGLAALAWGAGQGALAVAALALAAASLGFWCHNRAPARIFMGDVGSGSIGLLVFALTALLWRAQPNRLWPALILSSAFVVDASLTLLVRMYRGRRWYTPHREHLYQWMVRKGYGHARAGAWYLAWDVLIAAPLAGLAFARPAAAMPLCVVVHLAAVAVWYTGKRRCLRRAQHRTCHVAT
jgi:UDP-N-acetylmuramyl pentapeptide phosphotransferase/UDP-N-acetylglucosamine-1-phosphate transferase